MARYEEGTGSVIQLITSMFAMVFAFALILCFIDFSKLAQDKILCDTVAKKYLYAMESGGITDRADALFLSMEDDLKSIGAILHNGVIAYDVTGTTFGAVPYGKPVILDFYVDFDNPLAKHFNGFSFLGIRNGFFNAVRTYHIHLEATAKW